MKTTFVLLCLYLVCRVNSKCYTHLEIEQMEIKDFCTRLWRTEPIDNPWVVRTRFGVVKESDTKGDIFKQYYWDGDNREYQIYYMHEINSLNCLQENPETADTFVPQSEQCKFFIDKEDRYYLYIHFRRINGNTLEQWVKSPIYDQVTVRNKVIIMKVLAQNLLKIHQAKILHRDVAPANIIFCGPFNLTNTLPLPEYIDFGYSTNDPKPFNVVFREAYTAPEVDKIDKMNLHLNMNKHLRDKNYQTDKMDIFSLGAIYFFMQTKQDLPIKDRDNLVYDHFFKIPNPFHEKILYLTRRMTNPTPESRPSLQEVIRELREIIESLGEKSKEQYAYEARMADLERIKNIQYLAI